MKTILVLISFFPLFSSAAIDFPTGKYVCTFKSSGKYSETKTYEISKVPVGPGSLPYIDCTVDSVDTDGHVMPTVKIAGFGTVILSGGITTIRMDRMGISFNSNGEPELAYCKKLVAP